jgi:predicted phosphohydrolase
MLCAIGDLHLSLAGGKEMDLFGGEWEGYVEKIRAGFSGLTDEDTVVLCGDTSWGMNLSQALPDFRFINELPGKKLLLKGNHDYFWDTAAKQTRFFAEHGLTKLALLHNNAYVCEGTAVCGTRGWFYEEERGAHSDKIFKRELGRLRASLDAGKKLTSGELLAFFHYPPIHGDYRCEEVLAILREYGVKRCFYGHLHSHQRARAFEGEDGAIAFKLVSADHINFTPVKV